MQLYSGPISLFTAKVRIALAEKDLAYERIEVGYSLKDAYLPHHPEVARLNPKGEVPVLLNDDVVVYDSTLILEYLEERYPSPPLYPASLKERARCRQLEAYGDEVLFPDLWTLISEVLYNSQNGTTDASNIDQARTNFETHYQRLDDQLGEQAYLAGPFSVADIGNFIFINTAALLGAPMAPAYNRLTAWVARVSERPAVRAEISAMRDDLLKEQQSA
jgi:glutathione S-transferase